MALLFLAGCETASPPQPDDEAADDGEAVSDPGGDGDAGQPSIDLHPDVADLDGVDRIEKLQYSAWHRALRVLSQRRGLPAPTLRPIVVGDSDSRIPVLRVVYPDLLLFEFDEAEPLGDMDKVISIIAEFLRRDTPAKITLVGHTDSIGSDTYNLDLSARRARNVLEEIISADVDPSGVETIAAGEAMPRASNATAEGRAKNRRVEILLSRHSEANRSAFRKIDVRSRWLNNHPDSTREEGAENDYPSGTVATTEFPVLRPAARDGTAPEIRERVIAMPKELAREVDDNLERQGRSPGNMGPKSRPLTGPGQWNRDRYGGER